VGGIKSGATGGCVRAGVNREQTGRVGSPSRKSHGGRESDGVGQVSLRLAWLSSFPVGRDRRPEPSGWAVVRGALDVGLASAPAGKTSEHGPRPLLLNVIDELGTGRLPPRVLLPRQAVHDEGTLFAAVKDVVVALNTIIRNHGAVRSVEGYRDRGLGWMAVVSTGAPSVRNAP